MTEYAVVHSGKNQRKWITCPTCRQRTDFENIAFVDEKQNGSDFRPNSSEPKVVSESSITVQGSYGTKVCFDSIEVSKIFQFLKNLVNYVY